MMMYLPVMNMLRGCLGNSTFTTELVVDHFVLLSTIFDLIFVVHNLAKFSSNSGEIHFEVLVHLLLYINSNRTLGLKCYADMNDAPLYELLKQANIKTDNQLVVLFDSSWQDCTDTGRSTGAYTIFYQGGTIYHSTYVLGPVSQSSAESEYNTACTVGMDLAHFRVLVHELLNKYPDIFPEEAPLVILDSKFDVCMAKNAKDITHNRKISGRVTFC